MMSKPVMTKTSMMSSLSSSMSTMKMPFIGPELDQALGRIGHTVDCLLRLSATIRHPAPHDQFKSRAGTELIHAFRPLDKNHVGQKFVQLADPLVDRLAMSMTMRRHYFKYREEHASRIARGLEEAEQGLRCDASEYTTTKTAISSLPGHLKGNKATSTFTETNTIAFADEFADFNDVRLQTSYAPTEANTSERRVPRIPPQYIDGPFQCPYRYMIIAIDTRHEWKYCAHLLCSFFTYPYQKGSMDIIRTNTHLLLGNTSSETCNPIHALRSRVLSQTNSSLGARNG